MNALQICGIIVYNYKLMMPSAVVVIPARFASTRFPGKPLAPISGKPMIQHVYERALGSCLATDVIVATDSQPVFEAVLAFGGKALMTSASHLSGTDRIAEAARTMNYDIIVNVQGDEPLIRPEMIDDVIAVLDDSRASVGTLAIRIRDPREIFDPNAVKVVFDEDGFALYFSRAAIPYHRDLIASEEIGAAAHRPAASAYRLLDAEAGDLFMYKHIGIYSYRKDALIRLSDLPPSRLEMIEKLEQLRAIENGLRIRVKETIHETIGVDTPEDLERIEKCLSISS